MDISNWSLDQIMQLPDNCFGRHWPVILTAEGAGPAAQFAISDQGLPDVCVLWYLEAALINVALAIGEFELRLGDNEPATWAEFQQFDLLLPRISAMAGLTESLRASSHTQSRSQFLRMPIRAQGRRLVLGINMAKAAGSLIQVAIVISSIPKEVPDCLLSV